FGDRKRWTVAALPIRARLLSRRSVQEWQVILGPLKSSAMVAAILTLHFQPPDCVLRTQSSGTRRQPMPHTSNKSCRSYAEFPSLCRLAGTASATGSKVGCILSEDCFA